MKNKLVLHQLVLFVVLAILMGWRWLTHRLVVDINLLWWGLGGVLGFLFVFTDRFVHALTTGAKLTDLGISDLLWEREKQKNLAMRSVLFVAIWGILAVFAVTSVGSVFARGLILGIGTHLVFDLVWDASGRGRDLELWFWQVKNVTRRERTWFVWGSAIFYLLIIWFL